MSRLTQTPSQTVGPYFVIGLIRPEERQHVLVTDAAERRIVLEGTVFDGTDQPVSDAVVEVFQADTGGEYADASTAHPYFRFGGFGRCGTDAQGRFRFETIMPGAVPAANGVLQAPHLSVAVYARGMLLHAFTRVYFEGNLAENDPVLGAIGPRHDTLIARCDAEVEGRLYRWDIHLQGDRETVFFDA